MSKNYDVIVVGAGSVGVPTAMALATEEVKTLVIDQNASPGQGENKHALGGIRATHSVPGKILICLRSLEIFSTWEETYGDPIDWVKGGYLFPAYGEKEEDVLKRLLPVQKQSGLNIDYVGPEEVREILPGINMENLRGGSYSPDDGNASSLLAINAFYHRAVAKGAEFHFRERVTSILTYGMRVAGVSTERDKYYAPVVVDAAGPLSQELCGKIGDELPILPELHEAGITEPVVRFFKCLVVDLRTGVDSKNYYFCQNRLGQVIFSLAPDPSIIGKDKQGTSSFLPLVSSRMVGILPRLKNLRVRRTWRGIYPVSPDGAPIVGWDQKIEGLIHATGMCGQGFMLGPGIGELLARMVTGQSTEGDALILQEFSPHREFVSHEALK